MNLEALIKDFRRLSRDRVVPYLTPTEDVIDFLNEAEEEACIRAKLIRDDATVEVVEIDTTVGTSTYALHPSVFEIISMRLKPGNGMPSRPIYPTTRGEMDVRDSAWRDYGGTLHVPVDWVILDETTIRLAGFTELDDQVLLEVYRVPLAPMAEDDDTPEIGVIHHRKLVQWALHRAFGVPDSDLFDADRSELAEREFTKHFGPRPRADMHRRMRVDIPHHTTQPLV